MHSQNFLKFDTKLHHGIAGVVAAKKVYVAGHPSRGPGGVDALAFFVSNRRFAPTWEYGREPGRTCAAIV